MSREINYGEVIEACRRNFGLQGRRTFGPDDLRYLRVRRPMWTRFGDGIANSFRHRQETFERGDLVWGHIVQANLLLFEPGPDNCPGDLVFSNNDANDSNPEELIDIAETLLSLKGTSPEDPELLPIAEHLTDEMERCYGLSVPKTIAPSLQCLISTTFFERRHLPGGYLADPLMPIVVRRDQPRVAWVLPERYWPEDFKTWWLS